MPSEDAKLTTNPRVEQHWAWYALALCLAALALEAANLALHPAELLLDRAHQTLDLLAAPGHLAGRALLLGAALVFQTARERVARLRENVDGQRLELVTQALALVQI